MADIIKNYTLCEHPVYIKPIDDEINLDTPTELDDVQRLQPLCHEEIERLREEAYQSGFAQGYSEGIAHERTLFAERARTLNDLLQSIPLAICENRQQLTTEIADIVLMITQRLFINQQHSKDAILHQITQIISQLNEKQTIEITVNPHDISVLQHNDAFKLYTNLHLIADENLRLGGCIVKSEHGTFDASLERQIDSLKHVLFDIKRGKNHE